MGVKNWNDLMHWRTIDVSDLSVPVIAIDAPNYMSRRGSVIQTKNYDRVPLTHIRLALGTIRASLKRDILPVFIFDGPPEALKRRPNPDLVATASKLYQEFSRTQDVYDREMADALHQSPAVKMYFAACHLKDLCSAIGIPAITAPSEAEMFAAVLCREGKVGTVVSSDADVLLFGSPNMTRSLQMTKGKLESATLEELKSSTGLTLEQLRDLAIICGCDFHKKGVKGLGPRKGIAELQRHGDLASVLKARGIPPSEREEYLVARESFDEAEYISTKGVNLSLKAPIVPRMQRLLSVVFGGTRALDQSQELVGIWREFGKSQSTLESWM